MKNKGISLIVLIITIVVIIILAAAIILNLSKTILRRKIWLYYLQKHMSG